MKEETKTMVFLNSTHPLILCKYLKIFDLRLFAAKSEIFLRSDFLIINIFEFFAVLLLFLLVLLLGRASVIIDFL